MATVPVPPDAGVMVGRAPRRGRLHRFVQHWFVQPPRRGSLQRVLDRGEYLFNGDAARDRDDQPRGMEPFPKEPQQPIAIDLRDLMYVAGDTA